jgi:U3 small nucleolar RNA-associated protein 5
MPAAVNARNRDRAPPAKKAKLAQSPAPARQNGVNLKALAKGPSAQRPTAKTNGVKNARDQVDESTAVVGGGQHGDIDMEDAGKQVIEISSAEEESEDESSEEEDPTQPGADEAAPAVNGEGEQEDGLIQDGTVEAEDLSFGDRLRAHAQPVHVDVEGAFADNNMESQALAPTNSVPNASSLGTVLTQALRTNDSALFESCLRVIDVDAVYSTVERLPSPLVGTLLQKLAERLHKKPGRAGMLMAWVQWSLACHGGYLASQPQLVKQLTALNKVLKERASGLMPLMSLKGRLDMLQAQLDLRKRNQRRAANDDEDEAVIYVEGEDDYVSSVEGDDESVDGDTATPGRQKRLRQEVDDDDESSMDGMPTTMEMDDMSEDGSEDSEGLIDDEAEETDDDDDMSEPVSDDFEEGEGVSESEEESKPERRSTAARAGLKSRR